MVSRNENYDVDILDMGMEGEGIAKINGYTLFVKGALTGEKANVKVMKANKDYGFAKLVKIKERSSMREEPECIYFEKCGGCDLQHMSYEAQLNHKKNIVHNTIKKALGHEIEVNDTIGMGIPYHYRNKVQYPVANGKMGFYRNRSHDIIESKECIIQNEIADHLAHDVFDVLTKLKISSYNEETGKGCLRHIIVRIGIYTGERMLILVTNDDIKEKEMLVNELTKACPSITTIIQNINQANSNVILGEKCVTLYGEGCIYDKLGDFKFKISPLSFYQVNPVQTELLYSIAIDNAQLTGNETVFDLYSGIGTISIFTSAKAKKVYGVEVVKPAVEDAKLNAELNEVKNVEFIVGEAEKEIPKMYKEGITADVVFIDPPRKGCGLELLETIKEMKPKRVVYISCNVATLARDLKYLEDNGFIIENIQPVDMFPQTKHSEVVTSLKLK